MKFFGEIFLKELLKFDRKTDGARAGVFEVSLGADSPFARPTVAVDEVAAENPIGGSADV